jgi:hypothetical protein
VADVQQWGRRESLIWPPHGFLYTLGALFVALLFAGLFVWVRFEFGLQPLERYYLRYYLRSETIGTLHPAGIYRLIFVSAGKSRTRPAVEPDLQPGVTAQSDGSSLPFALSAEARKEGFRFLFQEAPRRYANKPLHAWIARWIYGGQPVWRLFLGPLLWGIPVFGILLPLSIPKDIRRLKDLRYGRRLKGPVLVSPRGFNKTIEGEGIAITTGRVRRTQLRIPRTAENKHFFGRGRHRFWEDQHHPPDACPGGEARRMRHRLRSGLRIHQAVL